MEKMRFGDLADLQAARGSHALVTYGKPLRRYIKPVEHGEQDSAAQSDNPAASRKGRKRRERTWRAMPVLNLKALGEGFVDPLLFDVPLIDENAPKDGFAREGDVILALAPPFSCACIGSEEAGVFLPSSCAVIRMDEGTRALLDPWYLAGFLALPTTQKALQSKRAGGKSSLLTIDQLRDLTLLVPDATQQGLLGEAVKRHAQVKLALKRFEESEMQALSSAYARALRKDGAHE